MMVGKILKAVLILAVAAACSLTVTVAAAQPATGDALSAEAESDSLTVSLLTCSPGREMYEYYGHTALLVRNITKGVGLVFNYGLFDFNAPHFMWRFMRGHCDYTVGAVPLENFLPEYVERGSYVKEDLLNLNQNEANRIFEHVRRQCLRMGWTYPYNFFYDNCATRVRDVIVRSLDGKVVYENPLQRQSLRDIVHEYSRPYRWSTFGQDLLLGAEADADASRAAQQFAPLVLERDMAKATIVDTNGRKRPLVATSRLLAKGYPQAAEQSFPASPMGCALLLLLSAVALSVFDFKRRKATWAFDLALMLLHGVAGCIVTFMFFFSIHPTVDSNWLILLLNPLPLVLAIPMMRKERAMQPGRAHLATALWVAMFIIASTLMPQHFSAELYVLALILLIRNVSYIGLTYKIENRKK